MINDLVECPNCGFEFTPKVEPKKFDNNERLLQLRSERLSYWNTNKKLSPYWNKSLRETWEYDINTRLNMVIADAIFEASLIADDFVKTVKSINLTSETI